MSWKCHTDMISNKLSKYTGILNKLKHYPPPYIPRVLYFSIVNAHLNYGILIVWGFVPNRLIKMHKSTIRTITWSKYNAHTEPIFKIADILRLGELLDINALKFTINIFVEHFPNTSTPSISRLRVRIIPITSAGATKFGQTGQKIPLLTTG